HSRSILQNPPRQCSPSGQSISVSHGLNVGVKVGDGVGLDVGGGVGVLVTVAVGVGTTHMPWTHTWSPGHTPSGQQVGQKKGLGAEKTSGRLLVSVGTRLLANDVNAITMPFPLTEGGASGVPLLACWPMAFTSASLVTSILRSRTKTSDELLESFGTKFVAKEPKATKRPS